MPIGPNGEKRPPDVIANAVHVMKVATGQTEETYVKPRRNPEPQRKGPQPFPERPPRQHSERA